jgi:hypothetical protein
MHTPLLSGRTFTEDDDPLGRTLVVIDQLLAEKASLTNLRSAGCSCPSALPYTGERNPMRLRGAISDGRPYGDT